MGAKAMRQSVLGLVLGVSVLTTGARGTAAQDRDCGDFSSTSGANAYDRLHPGDNLDADHDGRACEWGTGGASDFAIVPGLAPRYDPPDFDMVPGPPPAAGGRDVSEERAYRDYLNGLAGRDYPAENADRDYSGDHANRRELRAARRAEPDEAEPVAQASEGGGGSTVEVALVGALVLLVLGVKIAERRNPRSESL